MKKIILLIMLMLMIPLVAGEGFVFRQGDELNLKIPVLNSSNNPVTSSAICQISINNPDGTSLVSHGNMSFFGGGLFNYTLNSSQTSQTGDYATTMSCQDNENGVSTFSFLVTPSGTEPSTAQGIIYLIILIISIFVFMLAFMGAIKIPWKNNRSEDGTVLSINDMKYVKLTLWFVTYILLIWLSFLAWQISISFLFEPITKQIFKVINTALLVFLFPVFTVTILTMIINFVNDKKLNKALVRGLPVR